MDFQIHGILPIASELRTLAHVGYTPAPDIVHETVGHVPFLIQKTFSQFLKSYAETVKKAIVSHRDLKTYELIRSLSDLKEQKGVCEKEVENIEKELKLQKEHPSVSEASLLSRFIWWTSEYGLIGDFKNPKIYGAGLISSFSEGKQISQVLKVPLTKDCLKYNYDITEFQPQLFVTPHFEHLLEVLEELKEELSWKRGGVYGVNQALQSKTLNTVTLNSGLEISGELNEAFCSQNKVNFLKFKGPTQLSFKGKVLAHQDKSYHGEGYSTPLKWLHKKNKASHQLSSKDLRELGIEQEKKVTLQFDSGILLKGEVLHITFKNGSLLLITFKNCLLQKENQVLFHPDWGNFDLGIGDFVTSVFSGAADEEAYGMENSFEPSVIQKKLPSETQKKIFSLYQGAENLKNEKDLKLKEEVLKKLSQKLNDPALWLLALELLEQAKDFPSIKKTILNHLEELKKKDSQLKNKIDSGILFYN